MGAVESSVASEVLFATRLAAYRCLLRSNLSVAPSFLIPSGQVLGILEAGAHQFLQPVGSRSHEGEMVMILMRLLP